MRPIGLFLLLAGWLCAQEAPFSAADYTAYGQMLYWKSLTTAEKKVFLHAYLYRTYELATQVKEHPKLKNINSLFRSELVDPVMAIFQDLDEKQKDDLLFWIDKFYRNDYNKTEPFHQALLYAFEKIKSKPQSLYETVKEQLE